MFDQVNDIAIQVHSNTSPDCIESDTCFGVLLMLAIYVSVRSGHQDLVDHLIPAGQYPPVSYYSILH